MQWSVLSKKMQWNAGNSMKKAVLWSDHSNRQSALAILVMMYGFVFLVSS